MLAPVRPKADPNGGLCLHRHGPGLPSKQLMQKKGVEIPTQVREDREGAMSMDLMVISYNCACKMDQKAYFPTNLNAYKCFDAQGYYFLASPESLPF